MKYPLLTLFLFFTSVIFAQSNSKIESILKIPRTQIKKLEMDVSTTVTYLPSVFSESKFQSSTTFSELKNATVIKIYYVYTQYKQNTDFDQLALDRKRLNWLNANFPNFIADDFIQWEIIEQTGCSDFTQGDSYFHGFVIIHRPFSTEENRLIEIENLTKFLESSTDIIVETPIDPIASQVGKTGYSNQITSGSTTTSTIKDSPAKFVEGEFALLEFFQENLINSEEIGFKRVDTWVDVKFTVNADGTIDSLNFLGEYSKAIRDEVTYAIDTMPNWKPAVQNGKNTESVVNLQIRISYAGDMLGMYTRDRQKPSFAEETSVIPALKEDADFNLMTTSDGVNIKSTAVYKGLEIINKQQKMALVMDVTGSMTTHIAGMLRWIKTHSLSEPFTSYTFFNDGDGKSTKSKKIGETGGIYMTNELAETDKLIQQAMSKGSGGEAPENDLEAVLHAFENDENADAVVLIGDNYSEVRDISLLNKLDKPVHVILVAAPKFVRCEYLKIAKQTGGNFILNGIVIDLAPLVKGSVIKIQGIDYKYDGSNFVMDYKEGEVYY